MDFHFENLYDLKNEDLELNSLKEEKRTLQVCIVLYCVILYYVVLSYSILFYSVLFYPNPLGNMASYGLSGYWWLTLRTPLMQGSSSGLTSPVSPLHTCRVTQSLGQNLHIEFRVLLLWLLLWHFPLMVPMTPYNIKLSFNSNFFRGVFQYFSEKKIHWVSQKFDSPVFFVSWCIMIHTQSRLMSVSLRGNLWLPNQWNITGVMLCGV